MRKDFRIGSVSSYAPITSIKPSELGYIQVQRTNRDMLNDDIHSANIDRLTRSTAIGVLSGAVSTAAAMTAIAARIQGKKLASLASTGLAIGAGIAGYMYADASDMLYADAVDELKDRWGRTDEELDTPIYQLRPMTELEYTASRSARNMENSTPETKPEGEREKEHDYYMRAMAARYSDVEPMDIPNDLKQDILFLIYSARAEMGDPLFDKTTNARTEMPEKDGFYVIRDEWVPHLIQLTFELRDIFLPSDLRWNSKFMERRKAYIDSMEGGLNSYAHFTAGLTVDEVIQKIFMEEGYVDTLAKETMDMNLSEFPVEILLSPEFMDARNRVIHDRIHGKEAVKEEPAEAPREPIVERTDPPAQESGDQNGWM